MCFFIIFGQKPNGVKTKEKILLKAIQFFNEEGVENVTTLYISKQMEISLGNLHYHYSNRNELLKAVIDRFLQNMEALSAELLRTQPSDFIQKAFYTQFVTFREIWEYRFLFRDRLIIARRMNDLEILFKVMIRQRKLDFDKTMEDLKRSGLMREDISEKVRDAFFQQLVIGNNSWVEYCDLFDFKEAPHLYFAEQSVWAWKPYLNCSEKEMEDAISTVKLLVKDEE